MKISCLFFLTYLTFLIFPNSSSAQKGERLYELSVDKSSITWVAMVQDKKYTGDFNIKNAHITLNDEDITEGIVFIDMKSITCKECGDAESAKKILDFVKSPAFFNSENMDYSVFKMYHTEPIEPSKDVNYRIKGDLTIIGYSNEISFPVMLQEKKDKLFLEGKMSVNRSLWHLNDPKENENKNLIGQTIELYFKFEGEKK